VKEINPSFESYKCCQSNNSQKLSPLKKYIAYIKPEATMGDNEFNRAGNLSYSNFGRNSHNRRGRGRGNRGSGNRNGRSDHRGGRSGRGNFHGRGRGRGRHFSRGGKREDSLFSTSSGCVGFEKLYSASTTTDQDSPSATDILNIAVEGCCHGKLDQIYHSIAEEEKKTGIKVHLLICCGDMQTLRNTADFQSLAVPDKYKEIGTFHKYYSGELVAPVPTIFVGGNHEASLPLQELFYGGWVAPNIYYMGSAGVINFGGLRIAGLSGIYKEHDYQLGHHEQPPYDRSTLRSVYHVRNVEVYRLCQVKEPVDIMISHDWPRGIEQYGDTQKLLRQKTYFREEVESNSLGSPAAEEILFTMKPSRWFAAHLHVKFEAIVNHKPIGSSHEPKPKGIEEVTEWKGTHQTDKEDLQTNFMALESETCTGSGAQTLTEQMTKFLSLDKCLPKRSFMQILQMPRPASYGQNLEPAFKYDLEWLAILTKTASLTSNRRARQTVPKDCVNITDSDKEKIYSKLANNKVTDGEDNDPLNIPNNFVVTAPPHGHENSHRPINGGRMIGNPQTDSFLDILELNHVVTVPFVSNDSESRHQSPSKAFNEDNFVSENTIARVKINGDDCDVDSEELACDEGANEIEPPPGETLKTEDVISDQRHENLIEDANQGDCSRKKQRVYESTS